MYILDQHIGGEDKVFATAARSVDSAIVAYPQYQRRGGRERRSCPPADPPHQIYFTRFGHVTLDHVTAI
ncbi:MAG: hypothetical protein WDO73_07945 [Ignavibacteriota bacterium]